MPQRPALLAALLPGLLCLSSSCRSAAQTPATRGPEASPELELGPAHRVEAQPDEVPEIDPGATREAAVEFILAGDYEGARLVLDELLTGSYLEQAQVLLDQGLPEDGLLYLDKALGMSPHRLDARLLKADGSLQLAEKKIATGGTAGLIEGALQDALDFYSTSGDSARALFGASRAAYLLGSYDEALDFARRGMEVLDDVEPIEPLPQRTWSEAAFAAYVGTRQAEAEPDEVAAAYRDAEEALGSLLGHAADDPYVWSTLSDLYEWDERFGQARATLLEGLQRMPEEPALLQRLARVTRKEGDAQAVIATFASYTEANPRGPLGYWYLGIETFDEALNNLLDLQGDPDVFTSAELAFRTCRELEPANGEACIAYELICRNGRGRAYFDADDLAAATREFLSMNELRARGIEWNYPGKLGDGINGLYFVADQYFNREDFLAAGSTFEILMELQPGESLWANNAGFNLRDASYDLENEGQRFCRAASGALTDKDELAELRKAAGMDPLRAGMPEEGPLFLAAGNERMLQARAIMERSSRAYDLAAELAPDDIRIVNDTGLVLVYYLHTDLERAERLLLQCLEMGRVQVPLAEAELDVEGLTEEERADLEQELFDLKEAWGDAYQNLGVLELIHRKNPDKALPYLIRSVEIGAPAERPDVTNNLIPMARAEDVPPNEFSELPAWGRPCR